MLKHSTQSLELHLDTDWDSLQDLYDYWDENEIKICSCFYCGNRLKDSLHLEHRVPLTRTGTNCMDNIVPSCAPCNGLKGTRTEDEFLTWLDSVDMEIDDVD